jgi:hypothetical protein
MQSERTDQMQTAYSAGCLVISGSSKKENTTDLGATEPPQAPPLVFGMFYKVVHWPPLLIFSLVFGHPRRPTPQLHPGTLRAPRCPSPLSLRTTAGYITPVVFQVYLYSPGHAPAARLMDVLFLTVLERWSSPANHS